MDFFKKLASNLLDDQENFTDLTQVAVVDADACISVLNRRFETNAVYTHCGPLLVAVNPYTAIAELYNEERLDEYSQLLPAEGPPAPHAFEMAARAYSKMMAQARARTHVHGPPSARAVGTAQCGPLPLRWSFRVLRGFLLHSRIPLSIAAASPPMVPGLRLRPRLTSG